MMAKRIVYRDIAKSVNGELLAQELRAALGDILIHVREINGKTRIALNTPSPADITTATQIVQAHSADSLTEAQQTLDTIKTLIQGATGKNVLDLTTAERWALLAGLHYQNQAIAPDMTIRAPRHWITKQDIDND